MKNKQVKRRFISCGLALALVLAQPVAAFATEADEKLVVETSDNNTAEVKSESTVGETGKTDSDSTKANIDTDSESKDSSNSKDISEKTNSDNSTEKKDNNTSDTDTSKEVTNKTSEKSTDASVDKSSDKTSEKNSDKTEEELSEDGTQDKTQDKDKKKVDLENHECEFDTKGVCIYCGKEQVKEKEKVKVKRVTGPKAGKFTTTVSGFTFTADVPEGAFDQAVEFVAKYVEVSDEEKEQYRNKINGTVSEDYVFDLHFVAKAVEEVEVTEESDEATDSEEAENSEETEATEESTDKDTEESSDKKESTEATEDTSSSDSESTSTVSAGTEIEPKEGYSIDITFEKSDFENVEVIHQEDDGTLDVLETEVNDDGAVEVTVDSFSQFYIASLMKTSDGKTVLYDKTTYGKITADNNCAGIGNVYENSGSYNLQFWYGNGDSQVLVAPKHIYSADRNVNNTEQVDENRCFVFNKSDLNSKKEVQLHLEAPLNYKFTKVELTRVMANGSSSSERWVFSSNENTDNAFSNDKKNFDHAFSLTATKNDGRSTSVLKNIVKIYLEKETVSFNSKADVFMVTEATVADFNQYKFYAETAPHVFEFRKGNCRYSQVEQGFASNDISNGFKINGASESTPLFPDSYKDAYSSYIQNKRLYNNVQVEFMKDSEGYWTIDSDTYNYTYDESKKTVKHVDGSVNKNKGGFWLFGNTDPFFGMQIPINFNISASGQSEYNGKTSDTVFKFSGDDDVFVYIDNQLVLDLGGVHDSVQGQINFKTGEVTIQGHEQNYKFLTSSDDAQDGFEASVFHNPNRDGILKNKNIYDILSPNTSHEEARWEFSKYEHLMTVVYFERGDTKSNCRISYNFTPNKTTYAEFEGVKINSKDTPLSGAQFMLYSDPECNKSAGLYTATSDEKGTIKFTGLTTGSESERNYYMKEIVPPTGYQESGAVWRLNVYRVDKKNPESALKTKLFPYNDEAKAISKDSKKQYVSGNNTEVKYIINNPETETTEEQENPALRKYIEKFQEDYLLTLNFKSPKKIVTTKTFDEDTPIQGNELTYITTVEESYAKNAVIRDWLSEYVDIVPGSEFTISAVDENGNQIGQTTVTGIMPGGGQNYQDAKYQVTKEVNGENKTYTFTATYVSSDKMMVLQMGEAYELDGSTYSVTFKVRPNETAYSAFKEGGNAYPHVGQETTDAPNVTPENYISDGKLGFYSNTIATVTYDFDGNQTLEYKKPVVTLADKYSFQLVKNSSSRPDRALPDAEFTLQAEDNSISYYGKSDSNGNVVWYGSEKDRKNNLFPVEIVNGIYILTETVAPEGYKVSEDTWRIEFDSLKPVTIINMTTNQVVNGQANTEGKMTTFTFSFLDDLAYTLPETGGRGIYLFTISGVLLMIGAALLLYKNKVIIK